MALLGKFCKPPVYAHRLSTRYQTNSGNCAPMARRVSQLPELEDFQTEPGMNAPVSTLLADQRPKAHLPTGLPRTKPLPDLLCATNLLLPAQTKAISSLGSNPHIVCSENGYPIFQTTNHRRAVIPLIHYSYFNQLLLAWFAQDAKHCPQARSDAEHRCNFTSRERALCYCSHDACVSRNQTIVITNINHSASKQPALATPSCTVPF